MSSASPCRVEPCPAKKATAPRFSASTWHPVALLVEQRGWGEEVRRWIEDVFVAVLLGLEPDSP